MKHKFLIDINDIQQMVKESVEKIICEEKDYDILYRGINLEKQDSNLPVMWLTTSKEYAKIYGDKINAYKISISVLDKLANEKQALKYLIYETDGYPFYDAENFNIEKMKSDGFTGYYYHETEYNCLNVCLFK